MKKIVFGLLGIFVLMQFIRPDFTNRAVDEKMALHADEKVMSVLKKACYDCHSDETKYPWTQNIAPASWVIADHVKEGRIALNFSQWETIDTKLKTTRLKRAQQLVSNGLMPIPSYTMIHKEAKLNQDEKELLGNFFNTQLAKLKTL
ncbi:MAG: heme-binding domain-containing protein [Sulfurospirillaceae bacterium]|nr:heme-binding domain-containing protein [Sulfurospirillaceae bacterium]MDD2825336.1 heme-binding domain-containing protein [Sulfurospirillaceae bacterium]